MFAAILNFLIYVAIFIFSNYLLVYSVTNVNSYLPPVVVNNLVGPQSKTVY